MLNRTKKILISLFAAIVVLAACSAVSFAADSATPTGDALVMLNGEYITFDQDSLPTNVNGRIMVPYRALFEKLGAEVGYDETSKIISGTRGDMVISMKNGDVNIHITYIGGETETKVMDVAPFINDAGRTYVPSRFVSEVLGYSVGWDQANKTVIIIDEDSIMSDSEAFSIISKTQDMAADLNKTYEIDGDLDASVDMDLSGMVGAASDDSADTSTPEVSGTDTNAVPAAEGSATDAAAVKTSVAMKGDITGLIHGMDTSMTLDMDVTADGETTGMVIDVILNGTTGDMYMKMDGMTEKNQWMKMNVYDLYEDMGIDIGEMMKTSASVTDLKGVLKTLISSSQNSYDVHTYDQMKAVYEILTAIMGDDSFTKTGNTYTAKFDEKTIADALSAISGTSGTTLIKEAGLEGSFSGEITITTDSSDKATAYTMKMDMTSVSDGLNMKLDMECKGLDSKISMNMGLSDAMNMMINMNFGLKESNKTVNTTIPAGDTVLDMGKLMTELFTAA